MRTSLTINGAKLFNIKQLGSGCRFGIKVSSKKQDGSYTKGTFINCKSRDMLDAETFYTLIGFLGDNEYNGNNTIEFIVMEAVPEVLERSTKKQEQYQAPAPKPMPKNNLEIDIDEIPFGYIGIQYKNILHCC